MANTAPFIAPFGLTSPSYLTINSIAVSHPALVANSTGINVAPITADNVFANVISSNSGTYLSLIANLISMNVLSGNNQVLVSLTSNQVFVNSISGNNATWTNVTSNQIFANSVTANSFSITNFTANNLTANSAKIGGNATAQTIINGNGISIIDTAGGPDRFMPGEIILQKGAAAAVNNFTINFATEVTSGLYNSFRVLLANLVTSATNCLINMRFSTDGTNSALVTTNYQHAGILIDGFEVSGDGNEDDDLTSYTGTSQSSGTLAKQVGNNNFLGILDLYLYDVSAASTRKSWGTYFLGGVNFSTANDHNVPMIMLTGGHNTANLIMKGAEFRTSTGTFTSVSWTLIGRRFI